MKKIFALVATASLLFSCSQEDITSNFEKLPINISVGQQTRANDLTFENEDEVGIYVVNYDGATAGTLAATGNQVDNERFTYNNGAWTPDETIYWKDQSTAADFYAYYPYSESVNIAAHPFAVMADQSDEADFWASDFLWGKATKVTPSSAAVPIVTNHSLSKILLAIEPGNGFTEESWAAATKSVKICNVKTNATIDLASGVATATGDDGEIIPLATDGGYKAMIVPQTVADNSKLIVVTVDGTEYVYRAGMTFKANTQHRFVITVNKKGGNVDVTIGEWEMDENINEGNAEEELEATIPNNQIWYTATAKIEPYKTNVFGANIASNEWDETTGKGVIAFDGEVTSIGDNAFYYCKALTSITIPNGVTSIGNDAFYYCKALTSITIPDGVTSIGNDAFNNCEALTSITIPDGVTSIGNDAFYYCKALTSITIPDGVTSIGKYAFRYCEALTSVTIGNGVTSVGDYAFERCISLKSFYGKYASNDNRCLIIDGKLKFFAPAELTSYNIPDSVTSIGADAFEDCTTLTSVTIPDSVTSIGTSAFAGCEALTSITIPDSVTSINNSTFEGCSSLESITIGNGVKSIGDRAFYGCEALTSITIPDNATLISSGAFRGCSGLKSIYGKYASNDNRCLIINRNLKLFARAGLTSYNIPDGVDSIGDFVFEDCTTLTSVTIPNSVTSIGNNAFKNCYTLTSITIPNRVTSIGIMAFWNCSTLASITIPDSVDSIGDNAFENCTTLTSVTIPGSVTSIGRMTFCYCKALTSIKIGSGVTEIGYYAFGGCEALTSITIPDSVTSISNSAFAECSSLESITIGNGVTSISNDTFSRCEAITTVYCKATTPPAIEYEIFYYTRIKNIYVPSSCVNTYKTADGWEYYANKIVGYNF